MNNLILIAPILLYYFGAISAQNRPETKSSVDKWFSRKLEDVYERCESIGENLLNTGEYEKFQEEYLQYIVPIEKLGINKVNYTMHHIFNFDLIHRMNILMTAIDHCLNESDRLSPEDVKKVSFRVVTAHASRVLQMNPVTSNDTACEITENNALTICRHNFRNLIQLPTSKNATVYDLLTLNFIGAHSCQEMLPMEQCLMDATKSCSENAQIMHKLTMTPPESVICDEYLK